MRQTKVEVCEGKYSVIIQDDGNLFATRYGDFWRDLTGDKLVFCLAYELMEARAEIECLRNRDATT